MFMYSGIITLGGGGNKGLCQFREVERKHVNAQICKMTSSHSASVIHVYFSLHLVKDRTSGYSSVVKDENISSNIT